MTMTVAAALAAAAARKGWSSDDFADRIQVNRSIVAAWLDGSEIPPARFDRRLLETLDLTDEEKAALTGEAVQPRAPAPDPAPASDPASERPARRSAMSAGRAIQEARRRQGWTTRELASAIHYRHSEIESWEDDVASPWKFAVRSMVEVLDFTPEETAAVENVGE
jgi:ribosome-binding protein aMBF1 (putative translation factor)